MQGDSATKLTNDRDYGEKLYEGKAKIVYKAPSGNLIHYFKDSATAFNAEKKAEFPGKGELNNKISCWIFDYLNEQGIDNHFVRPIDERSFESKALKIIPVEVVVRNRVAGSLAKRTGQKEGNLLEPTLVELFLKDDAKGDPLISEDDLVEKYDQNKDDLLLMKQIALKVNDILGPLFSKVHLILADFKLEFGKDDEGNLMLADEISPDTCRLWDSVTGEKWDKDRFRFDLGDLIKGYQVVLERLKEALNR